MAKLTFKGVFPPVTTPFDARGELDAHGLARNIERYNQTGLAGYVAMGSNGEAVHLTSEERTEVVRVIKTTAKPGRTVIAGVNELSTRAAVDATHRVADCGADAALVITPYFYKSSMTGEALIGFFSEIADRSPIPILLYNVPQNTGVVIESSTIAHLAKHENIVGVKDSSGNIGGISDTIRQTPDGFAVFAGNGGFFYPSLVMGATGAVLAVACVAPDACVELYDAVQAGDHSRARELQNRIGPLSHAVTAGFGVPGLKAAMEMGGLIGSQPRSPLVPLSDGNREKLKSVMRDAGLFPELE
jgi:4-hydroxy-tetrahydrodipicolinate synthase